MPDLIPSHRFRVVVLDVWGNDEDGWTVNDRYPSNLIVTIPDDVCDEAPTLEILKAAGILPRDVEHTADWQGCDSCYIELADNGMPLCELVMVEG